MARASRSCSYNRRCPGQLGGRPPGLGLAGRVPLGLLQLLLQPGGLLAHRGPPALQLVRSAVGRPAWRSAPASADLVEQRAGAGPLDGRQRLADVAELGLPLDHPLIRPGILGEQLGAFALGAGGVAALVLGQPQRLAQVAERLAAAAGSPRQLGAGEVSPEAFSGADAGTVEQGDGAVDEGLGLGIPSLGLVQASQVVQALGYVGVVGPQRLLLDRHARL